MTESAERILALDVSSKTGWAVLISDKDSLVLETYGRLEQTSLPDGSYPDSFVDWAYICYGYILELIERYHPDVLVIEETAGGSKNNFSQKILEWIHFLLAKFIKETNIRSVYYMTEEWRRIAGCKMTKDESKHNKDVKKYKEKNKSKLAYDVEGKRVGKLTRKHINIRRANEIFGEFLSEPLRKKNEDEADALLLGFSYHIRKQV